MLDLRMHVLHIFEIYVLLACALGILSAETDTRKYDDFLRSLEDFDIVVPSRVTREGHHVTYELHPEHLIQKRSADDHTSKDSELHYDININNEKHILQLKPNKNLLSPGFVIERKQNKFKNVTDSRFSYLEKSKANCHFYGEIVNQPEARVAVGLCDGMQGFIHTTAGEYFIEPIEDRAASADGKRRHVIYKRSALPEYLDPVRIDAKRHRRELGEDVSCGVKDFSNVNEQRERWESHHRRKRKSSSHHRNKRSFSTERYVETLVVVDPSMIKYHKNEHLETYVLTIMNMVAAMFYDASIGNSINIVLVRILLMEEEQEELVITHHADKTLQSFCKYQKNINFKDDDHPNHHDVAILLTRKNICSRLNEPCGTLGLAQVSGMCQPHRSCSISEDTGLALAYTVTHELGHNFGMHHDGWNNGCEDPPGRQLYIMSPSLVADSIWKSWSNCSKQAITQFIDRDWGYCLDDEPASHQYSYPVLPPGTMYDADHQCRLQYGTDDATICTNEQDVCSNLWCKTENRCSTHLEAAAEGTICGTNKWCFDGKCVKIGDRPEAINGEWGEWTSWTECTRTCGGGVSHSQRHCENPAPSNGGKYCLGERKRYRICNTKNCIDTETTFNEVQCSEFNYIPYKNGIYEWEHVPTPETPCQLHCKPKNHFFSVLLKDIVTDGTPCTPGTRNMCISGRCRHIGCDYVIDSTAREDRCGVCHGDGSSCTTVKSQFNESQGLGYIEAVVIPEGARNIRVEEVAAASNFLALQNANGEYVLNGHWFIQWSGDYKAAGATVHYTREGNKETVVSPGPLKEPLHVMLLLQSDNPGVLFEYTVPKDNITEQRQPEFHWNHQPSTHCTASCGGGSQRSEVVCIELEAGIVDDEYCNASLKPDDKQRVCNEHLCPARWWTGPWQHCSVTCGDNGVHHRTVICVRSLGEDEQIALDDEACDTEKKPQETEACHKKEPCPGNSVWIVGEWSSCNGNPCGQKYRKVECKDPEIGCDSKEIPKSEAACTEIPCGHYVALEWSQCTRSCGDGVQTRQVYCEGSDFCDNSKKPDTQKQCNVMPCKTTTVEVEAYTNLPPFQTRTSASPAFPVGIATTLKLTTLNINSSIGIPLNDKSDFDSKESTHKPNVEPVQPDDVLNTSPKLDIADGIVMPTEASSTKLKYELHKSEMEETDTTGDSVNDLDGTKTNDKTFIHITSVTQTSTIDRTMQYIVNNSTMINTNTATQFPQVSMTKEANNSNNIHESTEQTVLSSFNGVPDDKVQSLSEVNESSINNKVVAGQMKTTAKDIADGGISDDSSSEGNVEPGTNLSDNDLPSIPDIDNLPPVPEDELPALPNINDLPPLPKLEDLPPINEDSLPKLSNLGKLNFANMLGAKAQIDIQKQLLSSEQSAFSARNEVGDQDVKEKVGDQFKPALTLDTSLPKEINNSSTHSAKDTPTELPQTENIVQDNRPVLPEAVLSVADMKLNFTDPKSYNVSLGEAHMSALNDLQGKGPVLPRLRVDSVDSRHTWMPLNWSECSRLCGGGVRSRVVECLSAETGKGVEQILCDINTKPTAIEDCNSQPCLEWTATEWDQCSEPCGISSRKRIVSCPKEGSCDVKTKPISEELCDVPKCAMWVSGQWSQCSKQCDGGEQLRLVQCIDVTSQLPSTGCDITEKPEARQECNKEPCKDDNAALSLRCESNEMSATLCRALQKMGQCQNRFVALKCCKTCGQESHRLANKDRPKTSSMR